MLDAVLFERGIYFWSDFDYIIVIVVEEWKEPTNFTKLNYYFAGGREQLFITLQIFRMPALKKLKFQADFGCLTKVEVSLWG